MSTRYLELKRPYAGLVQVIMPGGHVIATFNDTIGSEPPQNAERNAGIFATRWVSAENRPRVSRDVVEWDWRWSTSDMPF